MEQLGIHEPEAQWGREEEIDRLAGDLWRKDNPDTQRILQFKGKQNRAPNPEYLPMVQDFVKSGQWSDVGDLQNTGLIDARAAGKTLPGKPAFMTQDEYKAFQEELGTPPTGFASGGQVKNSLPDFTNPAIINAIFKELQHG